MRAEDAMISFAYSFDRDRWFGSFASREEAIEAGSEAASQYPGPPTSIYIGQRVAPDVRATGHAASVIAEMCRRVRAQYGDDAEAFLGNVSEPQVSQLDIALEKTILSWVERNDLQPEWSKIGRVTEHPVQTRTLCSASANSSRNTHGPDDVASIGETPSNW
jgi:hypothetical protein